MALMPGNLKYNFTDFEEINTRLREFPVQFRTEIHRVIVGQEEVLDQLLIALLCNGHVLLTGVPGLAKTLLIKTLANLFRLDFNRIQCTPDLMPSDISGVEILDDSEQERRFHFIEGPVFTNLLLADEINRTSPRTQAALLQAMQESQVTVAGKTYPLTHPFIVFATQNPIDSEGTYPLPEAQLDRFLFNVEVEYPSAKEEAEIAVQSKSQSQKVNAFFDGSDLLKIQQLVDAARAKWNVEQCSVVHRIGVVGLGESSIVVAVSTGHRKESFAAAEWLVDELKIQVPIWKKEYWADGETEWVHPCSDQQPTPGTPNPASVDA